MNWKREIFKAGDYKLLSLFGLTIYADRSLTITLLLAVAILPAVPLFPGSIPLIAGAWVIFLSLSLHDLVQAIVARILGLGPVEVKIAYSGRWLRFPGGNPLRGILIWTIGPLINGCVVGETIWLGYKSDHPGTAAYDSILMAIAIIAVMLINGFICLSNVVPVYPNDAGRAIFEWVSLRNDGPEAKKLTARYALRVSFFLAVFVILGPSVLNYLDGDVLPFLALLLLPWTIWAIFANSMQLRGRLSR